MGFHSKIKFQESKVAMACGIPLLPIKTTVPGPAAALPAAHKDNDIIDQAIMYFRANVFFKNYEINTSADKLVVFLSVFIQKCIETISKLKDMSGAKAALATVAKKSPPSYHGSGFMKALLNEPKSPGESDNYVKYLTQLQEETVVRLYEKLFGPVTGMDLKFWLPFGKKKFMGFSL